MKKMVLILDGDFPESTFEFVRYLNVLNPVLLTGVFPPEPGYINLWNYARRARSSSLPLPVPEVGESSETKTNIEKFESLCHKNNIVHRVHKYYPDFVRSDLRKETRFADLALLGGQVNDDTTFQDGYLKEVLEVAECPVVIVPQKMDFPTGNILAYDGSKSSVYAIKQFAYIFPELTSNETLLITVGDGSTDSLPYEQQIEELVTKHFSHLSISRVEMDHRKYFSTWIGLKKKAILVTGSFGRTALSQLFKKSFIADLIKEIQLPLFIAHR